MTNSKGSRFTGMRRTSIDLSDTSLVTITPGDDGAPTEVHSTVADLHIGQWIERHWSVVRDALDTSGAVALTGFAGVDTQEAVHEALHRGGAETMQYRERSTPRTKLVGNVYTSTEYPADQEIALHCELTAAQVIPGYLWFTCLTQPESGGQTPVADTRRVLNRLPKDLVAEFEAKGWRLIRNYGTGFGPGWQEGMQTESPREAERYCEDNNISYEWVDNDRLRTEQVRRAIEVHPRTKDRVWFNHVAFWHESSLPATVRAEMVADLGLDGLPYFVQFGDGSTIPDDAITAIQESYGACLRERNWQDGDILIVDNLLSAHGRRPFTGSRKIVVAMTSPIQRELFHVEKGAS